MPEHLRALAVILALTLPVFWVAQRVLCPAVIDTADFVRRRNLWLGITLAAFLSHNYWLYLFIATGLMIWGANPLRERNPIALFFFLLLAVPPFAGELPGLGFFKHLFQINHLRFLALLILLPAAVRLMQRGDVPGMGRFAADWFLLGYLALLIALNIGAGAAVTDLMRTTFYLFIDTLLLYYVASRSVTRLPDFRNAAASLSIAMLVIAPLAMFEIVRHWLLYWALNDALGLTVPTGTYLARDSLIRAVGPSGHSIALGYCMAVGLGLWIVFQGTLSRLAWWAGALMLLGGLVASLSKGPWVGAAAVALVTAGAGRGAGLRLGKLLLGAGLCLMFVMLTPYGNTVWGFLPFVGAVDEGSFDYRHRLFEVSLIVIAQNPLLGSASAFSNPIMEQMRQGDGIIDMVNTYLGIALSSGVVGLGLFVGVFVCGSWRVVTVLRATEASSPTIALAGRALLGCIFGVLIMIAMVSPISAIPTLYWTLAGITVGFGALINNFSLANESSAVLRQAAQPVGRRFSGGEAKPKESKV